MVPIIPEFTSIYPKEKKFNLALSHCTSSGDHMKRNSQKVDQTNQNSHLSLDSGLWVFWTSHDRVLKFGHNLVFRDLRI